MKCPHCNSTAIILELAGVEIDYCPECGGIWLDGGELETLLADGADDILSEFKIDKRSKEKKLRCPACGKKMQKIVSGNTCIDRCPKGHGYWFDQGELAEIIAKDDINSKVLALLNDMFNDKINQGD